MRLRAILSTLWMMLVLESAAWATPVYLSPNHSIPTGHYRRDVLEQSTQKVDVKLWIRVRSLKGLQGWVPATQVLPSVYLSKFAQLKKGGTIRSRPSWDMLPLRNIRSGVEVQVLQHKNHWLKVKILDGSSRTGWVEYSFLKPKEEDIGFLYSKTRQPLYAKPKMRSKIITRVPTTQRLIPLQVLNGWINVRYVDLNGKIRKGYIRDQKLISRLDYATEVYTQRGVIKGTEANLSTDTIYKIVTKDEFLLSRNKSTAIYTKPLVSSSPIQVTRAFEPLIQVGSKRVRWGYANLGRKGKYWWPIHDREETNKKSLARSQVGTIPTKILFKKELFDMASSPAIPNLSFVSAQGIYKSINGKSWKRLDQFKNENYPIAITPKGRIFVGPYISNDHGSSFKPYIRWDRLLAAIPKRTRKKSKKLRILRIQPQGNHGNRILLHLDMGTPEFIRVFTNNGGQSWKVL